MNHQKKNKSYLLLLILISSFTLNAKNVRKDFNHQLMIDYAVTKTKQTLSILSDADSLPRNILNGQDQWNKVGIHDWTSGFWPGILWYSYDASQDEEILSNARQFTKSLQGVLEVPVANHDLGFMLYNSYGNGFRLTADTSYASFLVRAADSLMTLYNPKVGMLLSWPEMRGKMNWPHNTIIDNMINLELLFWATKHTRDSSYYHVAVQHASTTMKTLIRPDYTTYHVAICDTSDGRFIKGVTHQGYANNSLWARGQSWGIYGFTMAFRETGKEPFLETACSLADVFLKRLPEDQIPFWDFEDPQIPDVPKDASAAAIVASGLLELSTLVPNKHLKAKYADAAVSILTQLSSDDYLSQDKNYAMLMHATGHYPNGSEIDASIIYADYYFIEALTRLKKIKTGRCFY